MSQPTPDGRAVVRALDALTTQVKRIADHTTQGVFALAPPVVNTDDDGETTPDDGARVAHRRPVALATPCLHCSHPYNWHTVRGACAFGNETNRCGCRAFAPGEKPEPVDPWRILGVQAPADDEDAQRTTRRSSLHNLIVRATQGALTTDESAMLWHHVEAEQREADTARSVAAGNKRHVQLLTPALERAEADANHNADLVADAVSRADTAERELRVLRSGLRANGADPTQIQNLWAQIRLRNRQWREEKQHAERAEAALARVRHLVTAAAATTATGISDYDIGRHDLATEIIAALDGTEPGPAATEATDTPPEPPR